MADISWEHAAEARAALNAIVTDPEHGVAALSSAHAMSNLLKDLLPDAPREKSVLVAAAAAGLASSLREHVARGMDPSTAIRLTASSFSATSLITPEACSWVAGEIAIALGISAPGPADPLGGTPPGFARLDQQDAATQMPPGFGTGFAPGQAQGYPQGQAAGPTHRYPPGYSDGPTEGYPQGPGEGDGFTGDGFTGGPRRPRRGGFTGGPRRPRRGGFTGGPRRPRRGFLLAGGLVVAFIAVIAVIAVMGSPRPHGPAPPASLTPSPTPSPTLNPASPVAAVESLNQIINPPGLAPIGSHCQLAGLARLNAATLTHRLRCDTTVPSMYVWAYQFDNAADYQQGFVHLQSYLAFKPSGAGRNCPPTRGRIAGATRWRSSNPKYHFLAGQYLDCLIIHGTYGTEVTYLWTLPSQHVVFLAQSWSTRITFGTLDNWWSHLSYG